MEGDGTCEPLAQLLQPRKWGLFALVTVPMVEATRPPGAHLADSLGTRRSRGPQPGWWGPLGFWGLWDHCSKWPGELTGDLTNSLTLVLLTGLCDPIFLVLPIRKQGL